MCVSLSLPPSLPPSNNYDVVYFDPPTVLTPLAYAILEHIPIPVVLGVFVYLAYSSLSHLQVTKRIKLLFVPPKHHPDLYYIRKVVYMICTVRIRCKRYKAKRLSSRVNMFVSLYKPI